MPVWAKTLPCGICIGTGAIAFELGVPCGIYLYIVVGVLVIGLSVVSPRYEFTINKLSFFRPKGSSLVLKNNKLKGKHVE
jgi:hypothetical protein